MDDEMPGVQFTWTINAPAALAMAAMLCAGAGWVARAEGKFQATDTVVTKLVTDTADLNNLRYRMGAGEARMDGLGVRLDKFAESIVGSIDGMRREVGTLTTKVEVMSQKIDMLAPVRPRPTSATLN